MEESITCHFSFRSAQPRQGRAVEGNLLHCIYCRVYIYTVCALLFLINHALFLALAEN